MNSYDQLALKERQALDVLSKGTEKNPVPYSKICNRFHRNPKRYIKSLKDLGYPIVEKHGVGAYLPKEI